MYSTYISVGYTNYKYLKYIKYVESGVKDAFQKLWFNNSLYGCWSLWPCLSGLEGVSRTNMPVTSWNMHPLGIEPLIKFCNFGLLKTAETTLTVYLEPKWWKRFIFIPIWGNDPIFDYIIFFRWVETTNQKTWDGKTWICFFLLVGWMVSFGTASMWQCFPGCRLEEFFYMVQILCVICGLFMQKGRFVLKKDEQRTSSRPLGLLETTKKYWGTWS